jgi:hypothetical protein
MRVCSEKGCNGKHLAQGYCRQHWREFCAKRCSFKDCERLAQKNSLCRYHRRREQRGISLDAPSGLGYFDQKFCSEADCENPQMALGLCGFHYKRFKTGIPFDQYRKQRYGPDATCLADLCEEKPKSHGYCKFHAERVRHGVEVNKPKKKAKTISDIPLLTEIESFNWHNNSHNYLSTHIGKKEILQHRVLWEAHNGRKLEKFENIHHINGIRDDNRIENLELWTKPQPCGQRPEDLVAWVIEHYREDVLRAIDTRLELDLNLKGSILES